jgi:hypothetical protein
MKTKTYPQIAGTYKMILVAGLIFVQTLGIAGDGSDIKKEVGSPKVSPVIPTELSITANQGIFYDNLNEEAYEPEMEIEEWMSHIQDYSADSTADEEEYELEDWMCNPKNSFWLDLSEASEPELIIEDWMTNPDAWKTVNDNILLTSK